MDSRASAFAFAVLLAANSASAASSPTAAERETARRLMDDGKARTKSGDLSRALEAYLKAHEIMHVPTTGIAVARTHYAMGHLVEARDAALEVLRYPREAGEPAVFEHARKQAKEIDTQLKGRIPTVKIHIRGAPAAKVLVDDVEIPPSLLGEPVAMNPGSRIIVARSADGAEAKTQVALSEKDVKEIDLELVPGGTAQGPEAGKGPAKRTVTGPSLDGDDAGGERTGVANVLVYGGFGLAATGLVVGSITGVLAFSKAGDVKPQCENNVCDPVAESDLESTKSMAMISNIGFAVAAGGAVLGVIGLVLPKARVTTSSAIYVMPTGAGVRGSF